MSRLDARRLVPCAPPRAACHGGPGGEPERFAAGLHPAAPDLASPQEKRELARRDAGEHHDEAAPTARPPAGAQAATSEPAPGGAGRVHQVSMSGFKFVPATLEVHEGDVVEWKNDDFAAHTAAADDRTFDTGAIQAGETKRVVAKKKGRFPYFCTYHAAMRGTLVVE